MNVVLLFLHGWVSETHMFLSVLSVCVACLEHMCLSYLEHRCIWRRQVSVELRLCFCVLVQLKIPKNLSRLFSRNCLKRLKLT